MAPISCKSGSRVVLKTGQCIEAVSVVVVAAAVAAAAAADDDDDDDDDEIKVMIIS